MNLNQSRIFYFFTAIYVYSFYAFKNLIIQVVTGLDKPKQSILNGVVFFVSFFFNVTLTFFADKFLIHKKTLLFALIVSAASFQLMLINKNLYIFCTLYFLFICMNQILNPIIDMYILSSNIPYHKIRVFDPYGYIVSTCISEVGYNILESNRKMGLIFLRLFNLSSFLILFPFFYFFLENKTKITKKESFSKKKNHFLRFSFLIFIVLLVGINRTSMSNFLSDYYKNFLKLNQSGNKVKLAICSSFGVIGEIIIFNFDVTKHLGLFFPLLLGTFFQLLRFLFYFLLKENHSFLFAKVCGIEIMKGLTFSMVHTSCTALSRLYGGSYESMAQFIYNGTYVALGNLFSGIFLSGTLNRGNDFGHFFLANTLICLGSFLLIVVNKVVYRRGWNVKKE